MNIADFITLLETISPSELALGFDNVGLLVGTARCIRKVLVALDCTVSVAKEAVAIGADIVLTHHPLFFHGVKKFLPDDSETAAAYILIQNGIGLYAAHTNLDAVQGGVNDVLAESLGAKTILPIPEDRIGRIGTFVPAITLKDLLQRCHESLNTTPLYSGDIETVINKAWIVGGAGGDCSNIVLNNGCDILITGEIKHHEALTYANYGIPYIACGHYQSEAIILKKWINRLQQFQNDVEYYLTISEKPPFSVYKED